MPWCHQVYTLPILFLKVDEKSKLTQYRKSSRFKSSLKNVILFTLLHILTGTFAYQCLDAFNTFMNTEMLIGSASFVEFYQEKIQTVITPNVEKF